MMDEALAPFRDARFRWGSCDCVSFAFGVLRNQGLDIALPEWSSREEAESLLRELGGLRQAVSELLGCEPQTALKARKGDLVMWRGALGVCIGAQGVFKATGRGLESVPLGECECSWRCRA